MAKTWFCLSWPQTVIHKWWNSSSVTYRIGLGWAAYEKNKIFLTSRRISMHVKKKIYETYVLPVILYVLDCVNWTSSLCTKIETFQNCIMRAMTNKTLLDHVKITDLQIATGLNPLVFHIKSGVLKLFGTNTHRKTCQRHVWKEKSQEKRGRGLHLPDGWTKSKNGLVSPLTSWTLPHKTEVHGKALTMLVHNLPQAERVNNNKL